MTPKTAHKLLRFVQKNKKELLSLSVIDQENKMHKLSTCLLRPYVLHRDLVRNEMTGDEYERYYRIALGYTHNQEINDCFKEFKQFIKANTETKN